ncbi:MAG: hypothetical protein J6J59_01120 [Peptococcaceae bacterium]|nr:hypothetical protein [Peptococcaceae bacterium]
MNKIVIDDMFLTVGTPTTAGSKMLEGYNSLFEAEVLTRLNAAGYTIAGKAKVGEFGVDLLGETSYFGADYENDTLQYPAAVQVKSGEAEAAVVLDVNGAPRRGAAQNNLVALKPTYGMVSRYGTIPVACSGETVSVVAANAADCREVFAAMAGHDAKDGTSLPESMVDAGKAAVTKKNKVAVLSSMLKGTSEEVQAQIAAVSENLAKNGVEVVTVDAETIAYAGAAWNILMSAELCNNVSRYDGVKYGYRTKTNTNIDELYTNSRTEAFGELLKSAILFGSETLSTENYQKVYDKALRVRRVISEAMKALLADCDALLMPAASVTAYSKAMVEADKYLPYKENFYTAPASITGLPVVVAGGVQLVGNAFSEDVLLDLAELV